MTSRGDARGRSLGHLRACATTPVARAVRRRAWRSKSLIVAQIVAQIAHVREHRIEPG